MKIFFENVEKPKITVLKKNTKFCRVVTVFLDGGLRDTLLEVGTRVQTWLCKLVSAPWVPPFENRGLGEKMQTARSGAPQEKARCIFFTRLRGLRPIIQASLHRCAFFAKKITTIRQLVRKLCDTRGSIFQHFSTFSTFLFFELNEMFLHACRTPLTCITNMKRDLFPP